MTASATRAALAAALLALLLGSAPAALAEGRIQASNILMHQTGRDPLAQAEDGTRLFDRAVVDYLDGGFRFGLRAESYQTSAMGSVRDEITMKYAEWRRRGLSVRLGNSYATIGRGLLLRAYELPGVIREVNTITDTKYMDSRDLEGAVVSGSFGRFDVLAVSGRPLAYDDNPPGLEDWGLVRREGTVSGGRVGADLGRGVTVGHGYVRADGFHLEGRGGREEYASVDVALEGSRLLPHLADAGWDARAYVEYAARSWSPLSDAPSTNAADPHALYTALELGRGRWGLSWETKHYRDFDLPFNDAPNLVPELSPSLVNRRSHFLIADDERGHQVSLSGAVAGDWLVNAVRAASRIGDDDPLRYRLTYLEASSPPFDPLRVTVFMAEGRDDLEFLERHRTAGVGLERDLDDLHALHVSLEAQTVERPDATETHHDALASVGVSRAGVGSVTLTLELSDDPEQTDDPFTLEVETERRRWLGLTAVALLDRHHELTVFAGKRRGGTACTSGTCYLVPDFSGVEVRLASRF